MAVGKGSMARASKAATNTTDVKGTVKKTTAPKPSSKAPAGVDSTAVISGTSEEVMKTIVYQQSAQVLDREPEKNEIFGVGEAMPIYFF